MKHGTKEQKRSIALELKKEYPALAQSAYGRYLAVKTMEYGTAETRKMVVQEFYGQVRKLIKHKMASIVLEDIYRQYATSAQKAALLREFYGVEFAIFKDGDNDASLKNVIEKNPEKRAVIMKSLFDVLKSVVDREAVFFTMTHRAMLEYITNARPGTEIEEFIELIKENVQHIAYTKDGTRVVMLCLAYGSAKVSISLPIALYSDLTVHRTVKFSSRPLSPSPSTSPSTNPPTSFSFPASTSLTIPSSPSRHSSPNSRLALPSLPTTPLAASLFSTPLSA